MSDVRFAVEKSWQEIPESRRVMYVLILALVIVLAAYKCIAAPNLEEAQQLKNDARFAGQQAAVYESFVASDYKKTLREMQNQLRKLQRRVPENIDKNVLADKCYKLADLSGVRLHSVKLPDAAENGGKKSNVQKFNVQITFSGSFSSVLHFMHRLETQSQIMQLKDVAMKAGEAGQLEADAVLTVFSVPKKQVNKIE